VSAQGAGCNLLTAEGLVGAALAIVYARLLRRDPEPLRSLIGALSGMIVLPYLGKAATRREQARPVPVLAQDTARAAHSGGEPDGDPLVGVQMRLTYRTTKVLEGAERHPGASNRQLADYAEIHDAGQISKLLARLQRLGLLENRGDQARSKGEPNAWILTRKGQHVAQSISTHTAHRRVA